MLSAAEQEAFVSLIDNASEEYRQSIQDLLNINLNELNFQQKLKALTDYLEFGANSATLAAAARSVRDVERLAAAKTHETDLVAKLEEAERLIEQLRLQIAEKDRTIAQLQKRTTMRKTA